MTGTCFSLAASTVFSVSQFHRFPATDQLAAAADEHLNDVSTKIALVNLMSFRHFFLLDLFA
jgi:hypothetical protein